MEKMRRRRFTAQRLPEHRHCVQETRNAKVGVGVHGTTTDVCNDPEHTETVQSIAVYLGLRFEAPKNYSKYASPHVYVLG
jgi:hypothetical protein